MKVESNKLVILGVIGTILFLLIGSAFGIFIVQKIYRSFNPYLEKELSSSVVIYNEWLEIPLAKPIFPERPENEVIIEFEDNYTPSRNDGGLLLPDGTVIAPEIQVVDQQGNIFELNQVLGLGPRGFGRGMGDPKTWQDILPKDRSYKAIRIRSNKPIKVARIFWRSYDPKDLK